MLSEQLSTGVRGTSAMFSTHRNTVANESEQEYRSVKNILVAIDDHEAATLASPIIARTLELATAFSSKVWLLHIVPPARQPPFNIDEDVLRKEMSGELRHEHRFLHHLAQSLRERHIDATALLVEGPVVRTILDESARFDIELIILGCHRHGLLFGALTEFTEEGLLSKCPRPIMFIPVTE